MKLSRHAIISIVLVVVAFGVAFATQTIYLDRYTRQISIQGLGPVFVGHLSEDIQAAVRRPLTIQVGTKTVPLMPDQLQTWIEPYHRVFTGRQEYRFNISAITDTLHEFAPAMAIDPVNAKFGHAASSSAIIELVPGVPGQKLDLETSLTNVTQALINNHSTAELAVAPVEPELTLGRLGELGITDFIGEGKSNFAGSPRSRVHNINIGAKRFNDTMIAPGEVFSFNDRLGDTGAKEGYLPGLVIKNGTLVPEYGGGLCQVSTTMFRAAMESGLAIKERHPHAIPVKYYNPQGYDATIYQGSADLQFFNDTPGPILIQATIEGTTIMFDMYGVADGRTVAIDGPRMYDVQPNGALKAVMSRTVTYADGTNHKDTFYSNYKSPALFEVVRNPLE